MNREQTARHSRRRAGFSPREALASLPKSGAEAPRGLRSTLQNPGRAELAAPGRLPALAGRPIAVRIRRSLGPHLASASIPRRRILLDAAVFDSRGEFERILLHELFHFVWVRLSNRRRWDWEAILAGELVRGAKGELGWSAEWRKTKLGVVDARFRTARWRRYACESFCDTAAWRFAGLRAHGEFTLAASFRRRRRQWLERNLAPGPLAV